MDPRCPHCQEERGQHRFTCAECGAELVHNGQMIEALTTWDVRNGSSVRQLIVPLVIVAASGLAAASLGLYWIVFPGIAAAAFYYFS